MDLHAHEQLRPMYEAQEKKFEKTLKDINEKIRKSASRGNESTEVYVYATTDDLKNRIIENLKNRGYEVGLGYSDCRINVSWVQKQKEENKLIIPKPIVIINWYRVALVEFIIIIGLVIFIILRQ